MLNRTLYLIITMLAFSLNSFAFDNIDFPAVAQGHNNKSNTNCSNGNGNDSKLTINGTARINGTNGTNGNALNFCKSNDGSGLSNSSCDDALGQDRKCNITGVAGVGLKLDGNPNKFQTAAKKSNNYSCSNSGSLNLGSSGESQFKDVSLNGSCVLNMSNASSEYRFKSLQLNNTSIANFSAGDYWIETLSMNGSTKIIVPDGVRLFVNNTLSISNSVKVNPTNSTDFQLVGYKNVQLNTNAEIIGNVYANGSITLNGDAVIMGRVKSHDLTMSGSTRINNAVENIPFDLKFGKAGSTSVTFTQPFSDGITPLIFLMPTISTTNLVSDGPATVVVTGVTNLGFTWQKVEPSGNDISSNPMPEVHWIAVTKGEHTLSDGKKLVAGVVTTNEAQYGNLSDDASKYVDASFTDNNFNLALSQLQTRNNNCWLTSLTKVSGSTVSVSMDISEVYDNYFGDKYCQPGDLYTLSNETVAFLATSSGDGEVQINGQDINYHFGSSFNISSSGDLSQQCDDPTPLTGFIGSPTFVAGKTSRRGGDGGWLRRCKLNATDVSVVVDEDTYKDSDRSHTYESYGFMAFEGSEAPPSCFSDDFSDGSLTDRWLPQRSGGSYTPSIVNERLRITQNSGNQATSTSYRTRIPAKGEQLTIEFDLFAYGGSGADGIAIVLSDSSVPPTPGAFGGPLGYGYKSGQPGFTGGWLGFGLDEYGNFSAEGGSNSKGRRRQSVVIRGTGSGNSGYRYLKGTCANGTTNTGSDCLSPDIDNNQNGLHRYRIIVDSRVDGQSLVSVERKVGNGNFEIIIPEFDALKENGQSDVPDSVYISLTGSTGGSTNIHELDNIEVCSSDVEPIIDHYRIAFESGALSCAVKPISIIACANADCSNKLDIPASAQLTKDGVAYTDVNLTAGSTSVELWHTIGGEVLLKLASMSPTADFKCFIDGGWVDNSACQLNFADTGFYFDIPNQTACKSSDPVDIYAVTKNPVTQACESLFANQTRSLQFSATYQNPVLANIINQAQVSISSVNTPTDNIKIAGGKSDDLNVYFDSTGKGRLQVNYPEAGELSLEASYTHTIPAPAGGSKQTLVLTHSDSFVSSPVGFYFANTASKNDRPSEGILAKAGDDFTMDVMAACWEKDVDADFSNNASLQNFIHTGLAIKPILQAPLKSKGDPSDGMLGSLEIKNPEFKLSEEQTQQTITDQNYSEVGAISFALDGDVAYLGASISESSFSSDIWGRFTPAYLNVESTSIPKLVHSCGSFTYMDQPFGFNSASLPTISVKGMNARGVETKNYQIGDWWRYRDESNDWNGRSYTDQTRPLVNNNSGLEQANKGSVEFSASTAIDKKAWLVGAEVKYTRTVQPLAPFDALFDLDLAVDDIKDQDGICYKVSNSGNCLGFTIADIGKDAGFKLRYGRAIAENTYGPETEELRMPMTAQYWDGTGWILSSADSCSILTVSPSLPNPYANDAVLGYEYLGISADGTNRQLPFDDQRINRALADLSFAAGRLTLLWQSDLAPTSSTQSRFRGQVTAPIIVPEWLKWYWNWDGTSTSIPTDPRASAYFGTYRGHDRIIYWREVN